MCRGHWRLVPPRRRDDVWSSWHEVLRGVENGSMARHKDTCRRAVATVEAQL